MLPLSISSIRLSKRVALDTPASTLTVIIAGQRFAFPPIPHTTDPNTDEAHAASYDKIITAARYQEYIFEHMRNPHGAIGYALRALLFHLQAGRTAVLECVPEAKRHATVIEYALSVLDAEEHPQPAAHAVPNHERPSTDIEPAGELIAHNRTRPDLPDRLFSWVCERTGATRYGLAYDLEGRMTCVDDAGEFREMGGLRMYVTQTPDNPHLWRFSKSWWHLVKLARQGRTVIRPVDEAEVPDDAYDAIAEGYYRTLAKHAEQRDRVFFDTHGHKFIPSRSWSDEQFHDNEITDDPYAWELDTHAFFDKCDADETLAASWMSANDPDSAYALTGAERGARLIALRDHINAYLKNSYRSIWRDTTTRRTAHKLPFGTAAENWAYTNDVRALHEHVTPVRKIKADGSVWELTPKMQAKRPFAWMWFKKGQVDPNTPPALRQLPA